MKKNICISYDAKEMLFEAYMNASKEDKADGIGSVIDMFGLRQEYDAYVDRQTSAFLIYTYPIDMEDYTKIDLIGYKDGKYYRIKSDYQIIEELKGDPQTYEKYSAGFITEERSITDAIDVTNYLIDQECDEYPDEIGCITFRNKGSRIVIVGDSEE